MSIHVGSHTTESAINNALKKAWDGISTIADGLKLPNLSTIGRGFLSIFTEKGIIEATLLMNSSGEIHILCGKSGIIMSRNGDIQISGKKLFLDFEGNIELNSEAKISIDGKEVENNSDTTYKIKGARVDIN